MKRFRDLKPGDNIYRIYYNFRNEYIESFEIKALPVLEVRINSNTDYYIKYIDALGKETEIVSSLHFESFLDQVEEKWRNLWSDKHAAYDSVRKEFMSEIDKYSEVIIKYNKQLENLNMMENEE